MIAFYCTLGGEDRRNYLKQTFMKGLCLCCLLLSLGCILVCFNFEVFFKKVSELLRVSNCKITSQLTYDG